MLLEYAVKKYTATQSTSTKKYTATQSTSTKYLLSYSNNII
jgi:hypothetical protein